MNLQELNHILIANCDVKQSGIQNDTLTVGELSFLKLRDMIIADLGKIVLEDTERQVYIASIKGGFLHRNTAAAAFHLDQNLLQIAVYANEGLINQHTCEDVINEIKRKLKAYTRQ